jgi:predicted dehydrogenase
VREDERKAKLKWLIVGLGSIGRRHLRNLLALGQEDILLYRTHQSTLPDDELAPFPVETELSQALAHKPDAVIIANPTALHLEAAIPAAEAGCHLLIEKPVAAKLDQRIHVLQSAVDRAGVETLVGFQFRFHPVLMGIKAVLDAGRIGRPQTFRAHWGEYLPTWHPWEDYRRSYAARKDLGGGVVNTLCHPLDYVRWFFGEVNSLFAYTDQVSDLELDVEDVAEITLKFTSGVVGSVHLDYLQQPPAQWLEINGSKGHIRWDNESGIAKVYSVEMDRWEQIEPPAGFRRNDLFMAEVQHFLTVINEKESSRCSLADGIQSLVLTTAVHESADMGVMVEFPLQSGEL